MPKQIHTPPSTSKRIALEEESIGLLSARRKRAGVWRFGEGSLAPSGPFQTPPKRAGTYSPLGNSPLARRTIASVPRANEQDWIDGEVSPSKYAYQKSYSYPQLRPVRAGKKVASTTHMSRAVRTTVIYACVLALVLGLAVLYHLNQTNTLLLWKFKLRNAWQNSGHAGCHLRKRPLLFINGESDASVVWESTCEELFTLAVFSSPAVGADDASLDGKVPEGEGDSVQYDRETYGQQGGDTLGEDGGFHSTPGAPRLYSISPDTPEESVDFFIGDPDGTVDSTVKSATALPWKTANYTRVTTQTPYTLSVRSHRLEDTRVVYGAAVPGLLGGRSYSYVLKRAHYAPSTVASYHQRVTLNVTHTTEVFRGSFTWRDKNLSDAGQIRIGAVADNQFNARVFHRILVSLKRFFTDHSMDVLLHAGDVVQNPYNMAQWQTDFWDVLSSTRTKAPLLLARGNHDWDEDGNNFFVNGAPPRHDWKASDAYARFSDRNNVTHSWGQPDRGMYYAYSPHRRCRILVLDSNLFEGPELEEHVEWLKWQLNKDEWTEASLRIVVVHVPPFLEYWDPKAWIDGEEWKWSLYVRTRLAPLIIEGRASIILSGHQHAYSRGFLTLNSMRELHMQDLHNSSAYSPILNETYENSGQGTPLIIYGGAGGTLDTEKVEDWQIFSKHVIGQHHFAVLQLDFAYDTPVALGDGYQQERHTFCSRRNVVKDRIVWKAYDENGKTLIDEYTITSTACNTE